MASFRLNKVAKDFNVGIQTLVDYLSKKGHQVEQNPNTKISDEQYELLAAAFQSERKVKEEADKIELTAGGANQVVEANQKETNDSDSDEVIIKSYTAPINSQPASTASTPQPEPTPKAEPEKATEEQRHQPAHASRQEKEGQEAARSQRP